MIAPWTLNQKDFAKWNNPLHRAEFLVFLTEELQL